MKPINTPFIAGLAFVSTLLVAPLMSPPAQADPRDSFLTYTNEVAEVPNSREFRVSGGRRYAQNDARNTNVSVSQSQGENRSGERSSNRYGPYRAYDGEVVGVRTGSEFDVRIDGRTYNVSLALVSFRASTSTRDLNRGDAVRVYGRRSGDNEIRNANVSRKR